MPTYNVLSPLRRDGKKFLSGMEVELPEENAALLVKCGVLRLASAPAGASMSGEVNSPDAPLPLQGATAPASGGLSSTSAGTAKTDKAKKAK